MSHYDSCMHWRFVRPVHSFFPASCNTYVEISRPLSTSSESDISVIQQTVSMICPYTKQLMVEPVRNKICGHSYDKAAIQEYIKGSVFARFVDAKLSCIVQNALHYGMLYEYFSMTIHIDCVRYFFVECDLFFTSLLYRINIYWNNSS